MGGGGCQVTTGTGAGNPDNFPVAGFIGTHICFSAKKIKRTNGSGEMFKNPYVKEVPPPLPPQCDKLLKGTNCTITLRRGGLGGQALSPPLKHVSLFFYGE